MPEGRANPNQLLIAEHTEKGLAGLRSELIREHRLVTGSDDGLLIGLQLTHSGRYCRPNKQHRAEPHIAFRHPILDQRLHLPDDFPLLADADLDAIVEQFQVAAVRAWKLGFDFVDIKHCHGYLAHELLAAHTRRERMGAALKTVRVFCDKLSKGFAQTLPVSTLEFGSQRLIRFLSDTTQSDPPAGSLDLEFPSPSKLCFHIVTALG